MTNKVAEVVAAVQKPKSRTLDLSLTKNHYRAWLNEIVDWDFHGTPLPRHQTYPYRPDLGMGGEVPFAAGFAAAQDALAAMAAELAAVKEREAGLREAARNVLSHPREHGWLVLTVHMDALEEALSANQDKPA